MEPSDPQQYDLYDAEREVFGVSFERMTLQECADLACRVMNDPDIARRYPESQRPLRTSDGRGRTNGSYRGWDAWGWIAIPRFARSPFYYLHELAHHLTSDEQPAHGPQFCGAYLLLVRRFIGREAGKALRQAYLRRGIAYETAS